jgi:transposase
LVGADRGQTTLLPECLDEWIDESNPVRAVDAFVDALDLGKLGFEGVVPEVTGRPSCPGHSLRNQDPQRTSGPAVRR